MSSPSDQTRAPARPPWREPVRGGYPTPERFKLAGPEQLRALLDGLTPPPPISRLTGMHLAAFEAGSATFEMPLTDWLRSPQGAISIGPLTIPADGAAACAIQTALGPATPFSTSELSLRLLRPARPGGKIVARGRLIEARRTIGLADVALTDEQGQLIAHGSSLCSILPAVTAAAPASREEPAIEDATPDPWQRPAQGEVLPQEVWERTAGIEVLRAQLAGTLPQSPVHYLTGLTLTAVSADRVTFVMPASEWLCAPAARRVQGGMTAVLAETALSAAIQTRIPAATALAPIDLKLNYLRPLAADGRDAIAHGWVVHSGRRIAVAHAEVLNADEKPVAIATGSAMILPGRPASLGAIES